MYSNLQQRIRTAILYGAGILLFMIGGYFYTAILSILFAIIVTMSLRELQPLLEAKHLRPLKYWVLGLGLSFLPLHILLGLNVDGPFLQFPQSQADKLRIFSAFGINLVFWLLIALCVALFGFFTLLLRRGPKELPGAVAGIFTGLYLALPFVAALLLLYLMPYGWVWVLLAFVTPWITDSLGYFYGSKYGKAKIFPQLSPGKTWQGFWAAQWGTAILYGLLALILLYPFYDVLPHPALLFLLGMLAGFSISLADQFGDLFASAQKRYFGVKDFGDFFPGHGGFMDRFDSTFFTLPMMLAWAIILTSFIAV